MAMFQAAATTKKPKPKPTPAPAPAAPPKPTGLFATGNQLAQPALGIYNQFAQQVQGQPQMTPQAFSADRQRIESETFNRLKGDLDTRYGQESAEFEQRMANEGVDIGTPKYQREKQLFERARNEAYNDARFKSMQAGSDEQNRLFGLDEKTRQMNINQLAAVINPALNRETQIMQGTLQTDQQKWQTKENKLDRVNRLAIASKSVPKGAPSMSPQQLLELIKSLTGEDLSG